MSSTLSENCDWGTRLSQEMLLVSRSGKAAGALPCAADFVAVRSFSRDAWSCDFSASPGVQPTSDTPLHWACLLRAPAEFQWPSRPKVSLHGHALAEKAGLKKAEELQLPISHEETLFSTPEDVEALMKLFQQFPRGNDDVVVPFQGAFYEFMNQFFVFLFLVEWLLRVMKDKQKYFVPVKAEHILDTLIVWVCGVLLGWIIPLAVQSAERSPIAQSLNVLRSMRTLRFFEFLKHFETFKMLLAGILGTANTLAACVALLAMMDLMFGIIAIELIGNHEPWGLAERGTAVWSFQNGLIQSCMGMTRFIFSDNAINVLEELMVKQPLIWIFCFLYMAISAYVILNLVTAVICEKAQSMTQENAAERAKELREEEKKTLKELKALFLRLDADGSGQVTTEEFDDAFQIAECRDKFLVLGFDEAEAKKLFKVLDADGEGELSVSEFTRGMSEVKGEATAKGMLIAKKKAEKLEKLLMKLLPQDDTAQGEEDRRAIEEAEPERIGELLETQMRDFEKAAHTRLDEMQGQCELVKSAAANLEELVGKLKERVRQGQLSSAADAKILDRESHAQS
ncbi:unnamed protein product [Effrenium voratum]|nr:unnamed protein product [Effrenium voratum]